MARTFQIGLLELIRSVFVELVEVLDGKEYEGRPLPNPPDVWWNKNSQVGKSGFLLACLCGVSSNLYALWFFFTDSLNLALQWVAFGSTLMVGGIVCNWWYTHRADSSDAVYPVMAAFFATVCWAPHFILQINDQAFMHRSFGVFAIIWRAFLEKFCHRTIECIAIAILATLNECLVTKLSFEKHGLEMPIRVHLALITTTVFQILISRFRLVEWRKLYDVQQQLVEEKAACKSLLSMLCDCLLCVATDCDTTVQSAPAFDVLVGKPAQGKKLSGLLPVHAEERERLKAAFSRATHAPVALPVTFLGKYGVLVSCDLFIVKCHVDDRSCGFLVGIRHSQDDADQAIAGNRSDEAHTTGVSARGRIPVETLGTESIQQPEVTDASKANLRHCSSLSISSLTHESVFEQIKTDACTQTASLERPPVLPRERRARSEVCEVPIAKRCVRLCSSTCVLPQFAPTSSSSICALVMTFIRRVNSNGIGCCSFHITVARVSALLKELRRFECNTRFTPYDDWQCTQCRLMGDADEDDGDDGMELPCVICGGLERTFPRSPTESRQGTDTIESPGSSSVAENLVEARVATT